MCGGEQPPANADSAATVERVFREERGRLAVLQAEADRDPPAITDGWDGDVSDERLRLFFTCCNPTLAREAQLALTLRYLAGLSTAEVARAFLVPVATISQRLVVLC